MSDQNQNSEKPQINENLSTTREDKSHKNTMDEVRTLMNQMAKASSLSEIRALDAKAEQLLSENGLSSSSLEQDLTEKEREAENKVESKEKIESKEKDTDIAKSKLDKDKKLKKEEDKNKPGPEREISLADIVDDPLGFVNYGGKNNKNAVGRDLNTSGILDELRDLKNEIMTSTEGRSNAISDMNQTKIQLEVNKNSGEVSITQNSMVDLKIIAQDSEGDKPLEKVSNFLETSGNAKTEEKSHKTKENQTATDSLKSTSPVSMTNDISPPSTLRNAGTEKVMNQQKGGQSQPQGKY